MSSSEASLGTPRICRDVREQEIVSDLFQVVLTFEACDGGTHLVVILAHRFGSFGGLRGGRRAAASLRCSRNLGRISITSKKLEKSSC